ncbi:hypothetical protein [uncultured Psychrobacter sp.]|jgi:hypothetical protein|uniref:hypothetical protein n=1 Tax=uncultured Psychrobacter sp. TaxID=259303 RepID=UPI0023B694BD|nr:hypothetical protein [uncultured Psychrobacter sp.]
MKKIAALLSLAILATSTHSVAKTDICYSKVPLGQNYDHLFMCKNLGLETDIDGLEAKGYKIKQISALPSEGRLPERVVILVSND